MTWCRWTTIHCLSQCRAVYVASRPQRVEISPPPTMCFYYISQTWFIHTLHSIAIEVTDTGGIAWKIQIRGSYEQMDNITWVRSRNCGCLVTWFRYQLIAKPGKKTATVTWPDPHISPDRAVIAWDGEWGARVGIGGVLVMEYGTTPYLSSYPGYYRKHHWFSMGLPVISRLTWQVCGCCCHVHDSQVLNIDRDVSGGVEDWQAAMYLMLTWSVGIPPNPTSQQSLAQP